jgi:cytoskeletal protein CcmA (bactofilin family)
MSRLGPSVHLKGEISSDEDLHIDCTVEGLVLLDERKLTVGTVTSVTADIFAGEVVIYGKVKGNVRAKGRIEIKKDGSVDGDLTKGARKRKPTKTFFRQLHNLSGRQGDKEGAGAEVA